MTFKQLHGGTFDLSEVAMELCAKEIGPAFIYTLTVGPRHRVYAQGLIKRLNAETMLNPFAPTINLVVDHAIIGDTWYITANGESVGSKGFE